MYTRGVRERRRREKGEGEGGGEREREEAKGSENMYEKSFSTDPFI